MDFVRFPSIENSYRRKFIDIFLAEFPELGSETYVVTEKLHGASLQLALSPGEAMYVGSRNRFLKPNDKFYNIWDTLDKYEKLIKEFQRYVEKTSVSLRLFGEYFGRGVKKGVDYGLGHRIKFFGLMIDSQLQPLKILHDLTLCSNVVSVLGLFGSLDEALSFNIERNTLEGSLAEQGANLMEGVIIQPYDKIYRNAGGHTFMLKKKNEAFKEKAEAKKPRLPNAPEVEYLNLEFRSYLTDARLQGVFSKHGEIEEPKQIGDYIRLVLADAREDFMKDHEEAFIGLSKKEQGQVLNVGSAIAQMLKQAL